LENRNLNAALSLRKRSFKSLCRSTPPASVTVPRI
jgi:hypothetical protein